MIGFNGGLIGSRRGVSVLSAPGVWALQEQVVSRSENQWPIVIHPSLLLRFEGSNGSTTFTDNGPFNFTPSVFGNAQLSTAEKKYGSSAGLFDGNGDYINYASNTDLGIGDSDFTIQFWIYRLSQVSMNIFDMRGGVTVTVAPTIWFNGAAINYYFNGANRIAGASVANNQWNHIALCKAGSSTRLFLNGAQTGATFSSTATYNTSSPIRLGAAHDGSGTSNFVNGYIDDLLFVKTALYTSNFTPPGAL